MLNQPRDGDSENRTTEGLAERAGKVQLRCREKSNTDLRNRTGYAAIMGLSVVLLAAFQRRRKSRRGAERLDGIPKTDNGVVLSSATNATFPSAEQLNAFVTLGHRLCSARTQREAIQIILDIADQFFGWDACTFDSYSEEQDRVHPIVVIDRIRGERCDFEPVVKDCAPTPRMRKTIAEGAQLILRKPPVRMEADSVPMGDRSRPSASLMCVPVRSGKRVIGLLTIQSYT